MRSINFKSDFKLIESGTDFSVPFIFEYNTRGGRSFTASYIDGVYTNCRLLDDGRLMVVFDSHGMGIGELGMQSTVLPFRQGLFRWHLPPA